MKQPLNPLYISVDIESCGPVPGRYSMLSLGACVVGDLEKKIYCELKPISDDYDIVATKVGSLGLQCLKAYTGNPNYDPHDDSFSPKLVLEVLKEVGIAPRQAMSKFYSWIQRMSATREPWLITDIQPFDGMFVQWYFGTFCESENPFGHKAINIDMLYKGLRNDLGASLRDIGVVDTRNPAHNALEDAIYQAKQAELVLKRLKGQP